MGFSADEISTPDRDGIGSDGQFIGKGGAHSVRTGIRLGGLVLIDLSESLK